MDLMAEVRFEVVRELMQVDRRLLARLSYLAFAALLGGWSVRLRRQGRCTRGQMAVTLLFVGGGALSVLYVLAVGEPWWVTLRPGVDWSRALPGL